MIEQNSGKQGEYWRKFDRILPAFPARRTQHVYDNANRLTNQKWTIGTANFGEGFAHDSDDGSLTADSLSAMNQLLGTVNYTYDALKRSTGDGSLCWSKDFSN